MLATATNTKRNKTRLEGNLESVGAFIQGGSSLEHAGEVEPPSIKGPKCGPSSAALPQPCSWEDRRVGQKLQLVLWVSCVNQPVTGSALTAQNRASSRNFPHTEIYIKLGGTDGEKPEDSPPRGLNVKFSLPH